MKLAASVRARSQGGFRAGVDEVVEMEHAGLDIVTVGEAYSLDAISRLGFLAARTERVQLASSILNVFSRTPTTIAMSAAGIDDLSGGRFILGLGSSGPQVVEGFHGVPFAKPLSRIKDTIEICRQVWRRQPLMYSGPSYTVPLPPELGTGLGKPLKLIEHPVRSDIPIWWASLTPKAVEATAEVADGWLPIHFIPDKADQVWGEPLAKGMARRAADRPPLDIVAPVLVAIGEDLPLQQLRDLLRPTLALYVGGMGARDANFYNDLAIAYGYVDEARIIQDLYLSGKKDEAAAAVPEEWTEKMSLIGSPSYIRERLDVYAKAGVTTLSVSPIGPSTPVQTIETLRDLAG